ncbi:MAG: tellurite resistance TerB family protein [Spirochaetales bacterium]|nr:tellurite resistance TerB family protein [Spirochaetales bacterium]
MGYDFKKSLILGGLIAIGSDGAVSDEELQLMNNFLRKNGITPDEEQRILKEITPKLGTTIEKGNLFKEVSRNLKGEEKHKIVRSCCALIFSDRNSGENEIKTLKKIGSILNIPDYTIQSIIDTEKPGLK